MARRGISLPSPNRGRRNSHRFDGFGALPDRAMQQTKPSELNCYWNLDNRKIAAWTSRLRVLGAHPASVSQNDRWHCFGHRIEKISVPSKALGGVIVLVGLGYAFLSSKNGLYSTNTQSGNNSSNAGGLSEFRPLKAVGNFAEGILSPVIIYTRSN